MLRYQNASLSSPLSLLLRFTDSSNDEILLGVMNVSLATTPASIQLWFEMTLSSFKFI